MNYEIEEKKHKICLECGHEISYGRDDKKFCNNKCRNNYHNKEKQDHRSVRTRVTGIINKNYSILCYLILTGVKSADIGQLIQWGFNPNFMTSNRKILRRNECWCYDIKYNLTASKIMNVEYESGQTNELRQYIASIKAKE